jgi:hypothetical protein
VCFARFFVFSFFLEMAMSSCLALLVHVQATHNVGEDMRESRSVHDSLVRRLLAGWEAMSLVFLLAVSLAGASLVACPACCAAQNVVCLVIDEGRKEKEKEKCMNRCLLCHACITFSCR